VQTLIIGGLLVGSVAIPQLAKLRRRTRPAPSAAAPDFAGLPRPVIAQHGAREEER
jgi:hypothetical protein